VQSKPEKDLGKLKGTRGQLKKLYLAQTLGAEVAWLLLCQRLASKIAWFTSRAWTHKHLHRLFKWLSIMAGEISCSREASPTSMHFKGGLSTGVQGPIPAAVLLRPPTNIRHCSVMLTFFVIGGDINPAPAIPSCRLAECHQNELSEIALAKNVPELFRLRKRAAVR